MRERDREEREIDREREREREREEREIDRERERGREKREKEKERKKEISNERVRDRKSEIENESRRDTYSVWPSCGRRNDRGSDCGTRHRLAHHFAVDRWPGWHGDRVKTLGLVVIIFFTTVDFQNI